MGLFQQSIKDACQEQAHNERPDLQAVVSSVEIRQGAFSGLVENTAVSQLLQSGIAYHDADEQYLTGKTVEYYKERPVSVSSTLDGTESAFGCKHTPIETERIAYKIKGHTQSIKKMAKICVNNFKLTRENAIHGFFVNGVKSESNTLTYLAGKLEAYYHEVFNYGVLYGQRGNATLKGEATAHFDGLFKKIKIAESNTYYHTIEYSIAPNMATTVFGFGYPLHFNTASELAMYLGTEILSANGSQKAFTVSYVNGKLRLISNSSHTAIQPLLIVDGVVADVCNSVAIEPVTIQSFAPLNASPLVLKYQKPNIETGAKAFYDFITASIEHSRKEDLGWTSEKPLIVLYDSTLLQNVDLAALVRNSFENQSTSGGVVGTLEAQNIRLQAFSPFNGLGLFFATIEGNVSINTESVSMENAKLDFMQDNDDPDTYKMFAAATFGMSLIDTGNVACNFDGFPAYDLMSSTTNDTPEANMATCATMQDKCITQNSMIMLSDTSKASIKQIVCEGSTYVVVEDETVFVNGESLASMTVEIAYLDNSNVPQVATQTAATSGFVFSFTGNVVIMSVTVTATGTVNGAKLPTTMPNSLITMADCTALFAFCVSRPSITGTGDNATDIGKVLNDYVSQGAVSVEWSSSPTTGEARYTVYSPFNTLLFAGGDTVTFGACQV